MHASTSQWLQRFSWLSWRDRIAVLAALLVPLAVCALLVPFRDDIANTDAALILVAAVVAVAANGHRVAGVVAALSAALWFDFLLTSPYERFSITDRTDLETTLLLLVVGVAVTELAVRGRRHRELALTDERYLDTIQTLSARIDAGVPPGELKTQVAGDLSALLGLRGCRFETNRFGGLPRLHADGRVSDGDSYWDVDQYGMPGQDVEVLVSVRGSVHGRFVLDPTPGVIPPSAARRCAVVVVGQLAAALAADQQPTRR